MADDPLGEILVHLSGEEYGPGLQETLGKRLFAPGFLALFLVFRFFFK